MEQIKIENYLHENPGSTFPKFVTLDREQCANIRAVLSKKLGLGDSINNIDLTNEVARSGAVCEGVECDADGFNMGETFNSLKIVWPEFVYINWYRFDEIDRMKFVDLAQHFDEIWYPSTDDIEIFDEIFSWVLSITHFGQLRCLRLRD